MSNRLPRLASLNLPGRVLSDGDVTRPARKSFSRIRRTAFGILLVAGLLGLLPSGALACSCGGEVPRWDTDAVFLARAIDVHIPLHLRVLPRKVPPSEAAWSDPLLSAWITSAELSALVDADVVTLFEVREVWRGEVQKYVVLNTGSGLCCDCSLGPVFEPGKEYALFAEEYEGRLSIDWCGGQLRELDKLTPGELHALGRARPPHAGSRPFPLFWRALIQPALILGLILSLALSIKWLRSRRRRGPA